MASLSDTRIILLLIGIIVVTLLQQSDSQTTYICPQLCNCTMDQENSWRLICRKRFPKLPQRISSAVISMELPNDIPPGAVSDVEILGSFSIQGSLRNIKGKAFDGVFGDKNVTVIRVDPSSVDLIEGNAFNNVSFIKNFFLGYNVHGFSTDSFVDIHDIDRFQISELPPDRPPVIHTRMFNNIYGIQNFILGGKFNVERLPSFLFSNVRNIDLFEITGSKISVIEHQAFSGVSNIARFQLTACNITLLDNFAFYGLQDVTTHFALWGTNMNCMGENAFLGMTRVPSLIPGYNWPIKSFPTGPTDLIPGIDTGKIECVVPTTTMSTTKTSSTTRSSTTTTLTTSPDQTTPPATPTVTASETTSSPVGNPTGGLQVDLESTLSGVLTSAGLTSTSGPGLGLTRSPDISKPPDSGLIGTIVGAIIGVVLIILLSVLITLFCVKRHKTQTSAADQSPDYVTPGEVQEADPYDKLNPDERPCTVYDELDELKMENDIEPYDETPADLSRHEQNKNPEVDPNTEQWVSMPSYLSVVDCQKTIESENGARDTYLKPDENQNNNDYI